MSHDSHPAPGNFLTKYVFSGDHKVIGIQFLFSGMFFWILGGLLAIGIRLQLGWPNQALTELLKWFPSLADSIPASWGSRISPEFYTMLFTMHATVMIFFVVVPWLGGAFGNYLIPLMIGAKDMAFPKLNMLSYSLARFFLPIGELFCRWWRGRVRLDRLPHPFQCNPKCRDTRSRPRSGGQSFGTRQFPGPSIPTQPLGTNQKPLE